MSRPIDPRRIEVVDEETAALLRAMAPHERIAIGFAIGEEVRRQMAIAVRMYHPNWPPERVQRRVALYMLRREEWTPNGIMYTSLPPGYEQDIQD